jgi:ABC-type sugar transport system permease subunit
MFLNLPSGLCLLLILAWPVLYAGWLSIHDVNLKTLRTGELPFAGLANYARLFGDEIFWLTLRNTLVFVGVSVALEVVIALAVALVIDDDRVGLSRVTRVLLLVPWGVPPVVNGLLWAFIFNTQYGYLNRVLFALGLIHEPVNWLGHPQLAMGAVVTAYVWRTTPFNILLYHAGLRGIPRDYYEAAEVDGASGWRKLWHITLPLLRPILIVAVLFRAIDAIKTFDIIFVMTQGGPSNASETINLLLFNQAFAYFNIGYASSMAVALFAIVMGASLILMKVRRTAW